MAEVFNPFQTPDSFVKVTLSPGDDGEVMAVSEGSGIAREHAAYYLRQIADTWDPKREWDPEKIPARVVHAGLDLPS